ncbi:thermonuclease family protein [Leisingera aquaemixtae]|uniref:thermonuclease family protein n=1 Tax=Leisingera aquaemixtae TaxID=1396826 RepID=UPI000A4363EE|nr:thermonuclease family protein [Leisingera aquaemixtae]
MTLKPFLFSALAGLVLHACITTDQPDADLVGAVTRVRDGDTIEVSGVPVRLQGLTCDERGSPLGDSATRAMKALVRGKAVSCDLTGEKTYDREVGRCSLPDGRDLGIVLIAQGQCGRCAQYDRGGAYFSVQRAAGPFRGKMPGYCNP